MNTQENYQADHSMHLPPANHIHEPLPVPGSPASANGRAEPSDQVYTQVNTPEEPEDVARHAKASDNLIIPPVFHKREKASIRLAYLRAVHNNVYANMSIRLTNTNLSAQLDALDIEGLLPEDPMPVRTLASAKRRLGLEPDDHIIQFAICPVCWKHYSPMQLQELPTAACVVLNCTGIVYEEKEYNDEGGSGRKRVATKIHPQVSLIQQLRRIMRRKGIRKHIRDNRQNEREERSEEEDKHRARSGMWDGSLWDDMYTDIQREVGDTGTIRDTTLDGNANTTRLSDHRFGLHLVLNVDWYVE